MEVWLDRRRFFTRIWDGSPKRKGSKIISSGLYCSWLTDKISGSSHGCKKGRIKKLDMTITITP